MKKRLVRREQTKPSSPRGAGPAFTRSIRGWRSPPQKLIRRIDPSSSGSPLPHGRQSSTYKFRPYHISNDRIIGPRTVLFLDGFRTKSSSIFIAKHCKMDGLCNEFHALRSRCSRREADSAGVGAPRLTQTILSSEFHRDFRNSEFADEKRIVYAVGEMPREIIFRRKAVRDGTRLCEYRLSAKPPGNPLSCANGRTNEFYSRRFPASLGHRKETFSRVRRRADPRLSFAPSASGY
jgi:hypothetical protein